MSVSTIPKPSEPISDPKTGMVTRSWWRFLQTIGPGGSSGVLPVSEGGTGLASGTSGGVLAFTGATTLASSALLTKNGPVIGGGVGATPTSMAAGVDGQIIVGQSTLAPLWKTISGDATLDKTGAIVVESTNGTAFGPAATALAGQIPGTATNDNAGAGEVGEYISSTVASGAAVVLGTGTTSNVTSIALTKGDWDVTGVVDFNFGATTSYTNLAGGVSATSATPGAQDSGFDFETPAVVPTAGKDQAWVTPTVRFSLSANTTVFLVATGVFTLSSLAAYGTIRARRVR